MHSIHENRIDDGGPVCCVHDVELHWFTEEGDRMPVGIGGRAKAFRAREVDRPELVLVTDHN